MPQPVPGVNFPVYSQKEQDIADIRRTLFESKYGRGALAPWNYLGTKQQEFEEEHPIWNFAANALIDYYGPGIVKHLPGLPKTVRDIAEMYQQSGGIGGWGEGARWEIANPKFEVRKHSTGKYSADFQIFPKGGEGKGRLTSVAHGSVDLEEGGRRLYVGFGGVEPEMRGQMGLGQQMHIVTEILRDYPNVKWVRFYRTSGAGPRNRGQYKMVYMPVDQFRRWMDPEQAAKYAQTARRGEKLGKENFPEDAYRDAETIRDMAVTWDPKEEPQQWMNEVTQRLRAQGWESEGAIGKAINNYLEISPHLSRTVRRRMAEPTLRGEPIPEEDFMPGEEARPNIVVGEDWSYVDDLARTHANDLPARTTTADWFEGMHRLIRQEQPHLSDGEIDEIINNYHRFEESRRVADQVTEQPQWHFEEPEQRLVDMFWQQRRGEQWDDETTRGQARALLAHIHGEHPSDIPDETVDAFLRQEPPGPGRPYEFLRNMQSEEDEMVANFWRDVRETNPNQATLRNSAAHLLARIQGTSVESIPDRAITTFLETGPSRQVPYTEGQDPYELNPWQLTGGREARTAIQGWQPDSMLVARAQDPEEFGRQVARMRDLYPDHSPEELHGIVNNYRNYWRGGEEIPPPIMDAGDVALALNRLYPESTTGFDTNEIMDAVAVVAHTHEMAAREELVVRMPEIGVNDMDSRRTIRGVLQTYAQRLYYDYTGGLQFPQDRLDALIPLPGRIRNPGGFMAE